jgi:hypothetical protein
MAGGIAVEPEGGADEVEVVEVGGAHSRVGGALRGRVSRTLGGGGYLADGAAAHAAGAKGQTAEEAIV